MKQIGRVSYQDKQYQSWLDDLKPFLKQGHSLRHAIELAGLEKHKDSLYRKYRLNDWFCDKVKVFQSYPGELVNNIFFRSIEQIYSKQLSGQPLTKVEYRIITFVATHHRSARQFFVNYRESATKTKPFDEQGLASTVEALDKGLL